MKNHNKGFTLMEMLIVIAIIAILVAVAIPVLTNQLEKTRESTELSNISACFEMILGCSLDESNSIAVSVDSEPDNAAIPGYIGKVVYNTNSKMYLAYTEVIQQKAGWQSVDSDEPAIGDGDATWDDSTKNVIGKSFWCIKYNEETGETYVSAQ